MSSQNKTLERLSFENLVRFYEAPLREVMKGMSPLRVFNEQTRRRLRKHGVLEVLTRDIPGKRSRVSISAQEVLGFKYKKRLGK